MSLVFFHAPNSTAVISHWALEEVGVPYEKVAIDLAAGDQKKPEFLALNPNGKVPLLVHDGTPIFESTAIAIHLGETFGVPRKLYPGPGPRRGEALKWMVWANVSLGGAFVRWYHNTSDSIPADERNAKAGERARREVDELLAILDRSLTGKTWLLGDDFTLVDVHAASWAGYLQMCGIDLKPHAAATAWLGRASARPGWATAIGG